MLAFVKGYVLKGIKLTKSLFNFPLGRIFAKKENLPCSKFSVYDITVPAPLEA